MFDRPRTTFSGSVCPGYVYGESDAEDRKVPGQHTNSDPVYCEFRLGNDLGYVRINQVMSGPLVLHPAYRPLAVPPKTSLTGRAHNTSSFRFMWAHLSAGSDELWLLSGILCNPPRTRIRKDHEFPLSDRGFLRGVFQPDDQRYHPSLERDRDRLGISLTVFTDTMDLQYMRCVRCHLTMLHPMLHLLQPNALAGTMTIVYAHTPPPIYQFVRLDQRILWALSHNLY